MPTGELWPNSEPWQFCATRQTLARKTGCLAHGSALQPGLTHPFAHWRRLNLPAPGSSTRGPTHSHLLSSANQAMI